MFLNARVVQAGSGAVIKEGKRKKKEKKKDDVWEGGGESLVWLGVECGAEIREQEKKPGRTNKEEIINIKET